MARCVYLLLSCVILAGSVLGDLYMQNPRGSNDRLNENGDRNNANRLFDSENNARGGYCWGPAMSFVEGSILPIEWTAQHGCGGEHVTCTEVIQYMCTDNLGADTQILRDGTTTNTIPDDVNQYNGKTNGEFTYGMMEPYAYYQDCKARERNKGIFTADQNVGGRAINTRQNPGGTRYGFECTEERDNYPYWHPAPWKDIAVLVTSLDQCAFYQKESQNVKAKNYCKLTTTGNTAVPNYQSDCIAKGGTWETVAPWGIPAPDCQLADFSRDNHLGNTLGGETANYTWIVPNSAVESCVNTNSCNCAIRIRYNITTNESTGVTDEFIDVRNNSILTQNPTVAVGDVNLTLALNTAQYGRTFQDRSYMFHIMPRPDGVSANAKIYNLNVRGKRGNIVQTFPATEYDYVPNRLGVTEGEYIHFQWTGCDTNPAGNAGEGRTSTDRSNIVQIKSLDNNIPLASTQGKIDNPLFPDPEVSRRMAYLDQTDCDPNTNNQQDVKNCKKLNAAPTPYFNGGVIQMNNPGTYFYTSTRNNNFSNRTQKGQITVTPKKKAASKGAIAAVVIGGFVVVGAALGGLFFYGKKNPHSAVGRVVDRIPRIPFERYMPQRSAAPANAARREPLLSTN